MPRKGPENKVVLETLMLHIPHRPHAAFASTPAR